MCATVGCRQCNYLLFWQLLHGTNYLKYHLKLENDNQVDLFVKLSSWNIYALNMLLQPSICLRAYTGHISPIMSLDFHPRKADLFCFCDNDNEIRYLNVNTFSCTHFYKVGFQLHALTCLKFSSIFFKVPKNNMVEKLVQGGAAQVRFQPRSGQLLAAASDKVVSIFDVETDKQVHSLEVWCEMVRTVANRGRTQNGSWWSSSWAQNSLLKLSYALLISNFLRNFSSLHLMNPSLQDIVLGLPLCSKNVDKNCNSWEACAARNVLLKLTLSVQGHPDLVNYICWDARGDYLASVSQNLVKIWSRTSGECIQQLNSNRNQFHSCVFHPSYANLLVIGGFSVSSCRFLELF